MEYWESKMFAIREGDLFTAVKKVNEFMQGKFVVGVQNHFINNQWVFLVSYKIKPDIIGRLEDGSV